MQSRLRADFQPEELSAVLAHYDLGAVGRIDKQLKGSRRSPKLIIYADKGKFLLKRRAKGRDHPVKVAAAHAVQHHLAKQNFPLAPLIPLRDDSDTMVVLNEQIYEMFRFVPGSAYDNSLGPTGDAGRLLAVFHQCLRTYQSDWEPSRRGYHDSTLVRGNLNEIPASVGKDDSVVGKESELLSTVSILYDAYESAAESVNEAGFYDWPHQIVHADWHPGNMLFMDGRVAAVIDYDSLHMLPAVTDVANGVLQFSIIGGAVDPRQWPAELDEKRFRQFLSSYEQKAAVPPGQIQVLSALMIEALVAEAVMPIAATGSFGRIEGFRFLRMISRKVRWLQQNGERLVSAMRA